jgi:hypothetical protein
MQLCSWIGQASEDSDLNRLNDDRTLRIDTMDLEHRFSGVDADCDNVTHWMAPLMLWSLTATTSWHLDAGWGAFHSIKSGHLDSGREYTTEK